MAVAVAVADQILARAAGRIATGIIPRQAG